MYRKIPLLAMVLLVSTVWPKQAITSKVLGNGLEVIVIENHTVPLATIEIVVKNGGYTESPEYDGLSHLYEHMFFKANEVIPNQEAYLERTRELGMVWNGTTSEERVNYFFTLSRDSLRQGMEFMKNAIRFPKFDQEELVRERPVVTGEFDRNEANPFFHLYRAIQKKLWYRYYSRKNVIGDREVILTATPEKMQTIQHRYYIPNNSALMVAGDIKPKEVFKLAEEMFGDWGSGADPFTLFPIPEHPPLSASEDTVVIQPINLAALMFSWHGPSVTKDMKSTFAADVFSFILEQKTSEFQKNLVDSGIALQANLSYYTLQHTGPITYTIVCRPEKFWDAKRAAWAEIEKFTDPAYYTDEQLQTAKTMLEVDAIYSQEQASSHIHTVSFWWAVAGLDYYYDYLDNLRAVTREDIVNYLTTYIIGKPHVAGVAISEETRRSQNINEGSLLK